MKLVTFLHCTSQSNTSGSDFAPCEWPSFMLNDGLWRLISNASISSLSVLKRHFFNNVKFCSAGTVLCTLCADRDEI